MMRGPIIALLALAASAPADATTLIPTDVPEMSREARTIVLGRVSAVATRWIGDRRGIETLVQLDVEDYMKGALGPQVQFLVPGGAIGRYRHVVVGAPDLKAGQRVVVFLGVRGPGIPYIIGFNQGLFRVRSENGESVVRSPAGVAMPGFSGALPSSASRSLPLSDFVRRVRAIAGSER